MRRKMVVGNWKMHGSHAANAELLSAGYGLPQPAEMSGQSLLLPT